MAASVALALSGCGGGGAVPPRVTLSDARTASHALVEVATANFETNTVSGCIGCMVPGEDPGILLLEVTGDTIDPNGNRGVLSSPYINTPDRNFSRVRFGDTSIDSSSGTFSGTDVTLEIDYFPSHTGSTSGGTWGGHSRIFPMKPALSVL